MAAAATFTTESGADGLTALQLEIRRLTTITVGDIQFVGQFLRSEILQRTARGLDVNGAPFAPYSTKGPYYFYPNGQRSEVRHARATAAKNRFKTAGGSGERTPYGIRYASYAAAKEAHGASVVNLFGMEQHTHMLNTMVVKVDGQAMEDALGPTGSELSAFENIAPARRLSIGFYGPEAERAKGHNEGVPGKLPQREFMALNEAELERGAHAIEQRLKTRAAAARG